MAVRRIQEGRSISNAVGHGRFAVIEKRKRTMKSVLFSFLMGTLCLASTQQVVAELEPGERSGNATILHRADIISERSNNSGPMRLWSLHSTSEARMNYVEVSGRSGMHFHPDADHRLYVLEGKVVVFAGTNQTTARPGDLIVIPRGVRH